jgi:hypothetical protein
LRVPGYLNSAAGRLNRCRERTWQQTSLFTLSCEVPTSNSRNISSEGQDLIDPGAALNTSLIAGQELKELQLRNFCENDFAGRDESTHYQSKSESRLV